MRTHPTSIDRECAALLRAVPHRPLDWPRARQALRALIAEPERTEQVFEITRALSGRADLRNFRRFLHHPGGMALLAERPSLLAALSDRTALAALPTGSLGREYLAFMLAGELTADGLVAASMEGGIEARDGYGPEISWFFDRLRDMHDLWHVLTGYGRDEAGEAANLAFTYAQIGNPGIGIIVAAAAILGPRSEWLDWQRYLLRAWRRGRRAAWLPAVRFEDMLGLPLAEARRRLGIEAPEVAHPKGVVVANRDDLTNHERSRLERALGATAVR
jgi:ubiquinone biosynthesis protein COQ4